MKILRLLPLLGLLLASCATLGGGSGLEKVYVVEASGGAWSAGAKARAAMESLDGLAELHMSGARAVFVTKGGKAPDEAAIAAAFEERGMKLERLDRIERPRAKAVYLVDSGITWATTAGEVRAALLEKTNALDVYFEDQIQILVTDPELHPVDAVGSVLEAKEIEFSKIEKSSAM